MSRRINNGPPNGGGSVGLRQGSIGSGSVGTAKYGNFLSSSVGGTGSGAGSRGSISGSGGGGRLHGNSNSSSARDDLSELRYVLADPPDVYPLPSGNHLPKIFPDFEPWKRTKEEDLLVLECLQRGHHQQPKVANESSSGKASMIPLLKQWTSLPALSFFLVNAMEIRERNCRISSNWTFKPPPRVTLTDQKREAWLRDLASPSVPLRRLSRTIPHGIRNRGLLEQCCNKGIPISRAVWFARCVGANELRGLKRKGMGGGGSSQAAELAWIRDWSEEVVGYIEKLVKDFPSGSDATTVAVTATAAAAAATTPTANSPANRGTTPRAGTPPVSTLTARQSWKFKIEYMTRLSAYLFYEQLLDRDIFLKWSLKFLHNSSPEELPVTLIFIRMLWKELISNRINSQLLALALLHQYSSISKLSMDLSSQEPFVKLLKKLADYTKELLMISSDSFVMPKNWRTLGPVLSEVAKSQSNGNSNSNTTNNASSSTNSDTEFYNLLERIRIRNESLLVGGSPLARASRNGKAIIIQYLDSLKPPYRYDLLASEIPTTVRLTPKEILDIVFSWATTRSRVGRERIFICVNLCLKWKENDWEISPSFLSFLIGISNLDNYDMNNVYDLVGEFVDHKLVSLGGYFRLVISSGVLFVSRLRTRASAQMLILDNLPLVDTRDVYRSQQRMLLSGLRKENGEEEDNIEDIKEVLHQKLRFLFEQQNQSHSQSPLDDFEDENVTLTGDELEQLRDLKKGLKIELSDYLIESFDEAITRG